VINCRSPREIECIRRAGVIVAETLMLCGGLARPGVTTEELDREADALIRKRNAISLFKGYRGSAKTPYPKSICTSVNEEVVHGIPGPRELRAGDIVSIDVGVRLGAYCADAAITVPVDGVSGQAQTLLEVCRAALESGIAALRPGMRLSELSRAIQEYVESRNCSVVRDYTGHGIGREMHEDPQIPNYYGKGMPDPVLPLGSVLAIEPMVNAGGRKVCKLENDWTVVTADHSLSAHFEHTVAITERGAEILTLYLERK
jgi:methionyl aminopeptidase